MLNLIQENPDVLNVPTTQAYSSGDVYIAGNIVGVVVEGGASGDVIAIIVSGIVELKAETGTAFTYGESLYWNATNSELSATSTSNTYIGVSTEVKASATALGQVFLNGPVAPIT